MNFEFNSVQRLAILASVVLALCACDSRGPTPVSPSQTTTYTLSGVVSERTASGLVPLQGAQVHEERYGRPATTDGNGVYTIAGIPGPTGSVTARKEGYTTVRKTVDVSADTRLDLEMSSLESQILFGIVYEMIGTDRAPVSGVSLYCDACGSPSGHTFAETDADGAFSFSWTNNGSTPLLVRKEGYRLAAAAGDPDGWIIAEVNGNTRFDIALVRR
jgi:hypothetical protein